MASTAEPNPVVKDVVKSENKDKPDDMAKMVDIVVQTWKLVNTDALKHGTVFYKRLFTAYPEVITMFSFSSEVRMDMDDSSGLKHQAKLLMSMIDYAVRQLGNLSELNPKLKQLGARHFVKYEVKREHFEPVGQSLLWTLRKGLGDLYTAEVEKAWMSILRIVVDVMIEGGSEALEEQTKRIDMD